MGFFIAGMAALGAGVLIGGIVAAATRSPVGLGVAAVIAAVGVAIGGLGLWESRRFDRRARRLQSTISERRLLALAEERGGTLRVADVVRELQISSAEAESFLDALVDEIRVSMRVTDDGNIDYVFRELVDSRRLHVRVGAVDAAGVEEGEPAESTDEGV